MRWDEISLTDDEDERSPSLYLEVARRALAQPASARAPPTVDSASLHAARTGKIQASPGGADRRAGASADRTAGATSTDGADATSPTRSFQVQARLAVVVRSTRRLQCFALRRETTLLCLPSCAGTQNGCCDASSVGARLWDAKTLCAMYFRFGSRFAYAVGDCFFYPKHYALPKICLVLLWLLRWRQS